MNVKELALKIQALRKAAGLTQEELAHRAGIGRNTLQRIEGAQGNPTIESVRLLSAALEADLGEFDESPASSLPEWASIIAERLEALEKRIPASSPTGMHSTIPPEIWAAWPRAPEKAQRLALLFLTRDLKYLKGLELSIVGMKAAKELLTSLLRDRPKLRPRG